MVRWPRATSFLAALAFGAPATYLGWLVLVAGSPWGLQGLGGLGLMLATVLAVPFAVHVAVGFWVPRPMWATAAAPLNLFWFLLGFFWQNRGDDIRHPEDVPFWEVLVMAVVVSILFGAVLAGGVALGAGLRERRRSPSGLPPYP